MMLSELREFMEQRFPQVDFYEGTIDRNLKKCIGIYIRGQAIKPRIALGGLENTSYNTIPITFLVHWTESSIQCETMAKEIYDSLFGTAATTSVGRRIIFQMLDSCPIPIERDENNICEMVIRANIIYVREVKE